MARAPKDEPVERMYRVIGNRTVNGKRKGETVTIKLTRAQERDLIAAGHVERVAVTTKKGGSDA